MPIPAGTSNFSTQVLLASDVATRVKRQFGDEASIQITDADILRWMNDAMREIVLHNDLLQAVGTIRALKDQAEYGLPSDILTLRSVRFANRKLKALSAREAEEYLHDDKLERGTPDRFWIWAARLNLYPLPEADGDLKIYYSRQPILVNEITDHFELPAEYHNRIVEYCLQQAYELDENWAAAQAKQVQFKEGVQRAKENSDFPVQDFYPSITSLPSDVW